MIPLRRPTHNSMGRSRTPVRQEKEKEGQEEQEGQEEDPKNLKFG